MHGMPGSPGSTGRDGRDGAKGDMGSPGKTRRQEQREFLVSRALPGKKESEGRKARVEIQERLSFPRT